MNPNAYISHLHFHAHFEHTNDPRPNAGLGRFLQLTQKGFDNVFHSSYQGRATSACRNPLVAGSLYCDGIDADRKFRCNVGRDGYC